MTPGMGNRREFLLNGSKALLLLANSELAASQGARARDSQSNRITLFLCGDVMLGRGIDQVLPHPSDPRIHERGMSSALGYVELAERAHGSIPSPVDFSYVWGDALDEWERVAPDVRIINLETSVTQSDDRMDKGINYRMHPRNVPCVTSAEINCCVLANNHVLDWGDAGLAETLKTLREAGVQSAGAGLDAEEAGAPAIMELGGRGRVVVFAFGSVTSGIPLEWAASENNPGVNLLENMSRETVGRIARRVEAVKRSRDIVVVSIHWGGNWGYDIPPLQQRFARQLIDEASVDVVHGHSCHHVKGIEVYKGRPILYGCGDFLNDYEGISGYEKYRDDLVLMYFVSMDATEGRLTRLEMTPLRIMRLRLNLASREAAVWLRDTLNREGSRLGTQVELQAENTLALRWD